MNREGHPKRQPGSKSLGGKLFATQPFSEWNTINLYLKEGKEFFLFPNFLETIQKQKQKGRDDGQMDKTDTG